MSRIGKRPEKIERRSHAKFTPRRSGVPHRWVKSWGKKERDPNLRETPFDNGR